MEQDWYLLTVAADLLAFLYVALFYQVCRITGFSASAAKVRGSRNIISMQ